MQKNWKFKEPDIALKNSLAAELDISSLFAQLLISRGISDAQAARIFLKSDLNHLHDPFLMQDMSKVASRIKDAIKNKENIFIATDFDVDGVTSCAILETALKSLGAKVKHYLPHRIKDGYGLNLKALKEARGFRAKVFIALDCGITSIDEARVLKNEKVDFIIIDHHEPSMQNLPCAFAILNPKLKTCAYPFKDLASVGLVYKLIQALEANDADNYLDLVALGTVADVAPLRGENRIFVRHGLDVLNSTKRKGLRSLIGASGIKEKKISTYSISFILAPRLNASGRVDSAHASLDLLLSQDTQETDRLALDLNVCNRQRQKIEEKVLTEAIDLIEREINFKEDFVIVLSKDDWHPGVLGIVASKIADRYFRPAIIISLQDGVGRGSARSIPNFHIYQALTQCGALLKEYGGHKYAAGLTIDRKDIAEFKKILNTVARENFHNGSLSPVLEVDAQIPFSLIDEGLLTCIDKLSPYGEANRRPIFVTRDLAVKGKPILVGKNSLKFWASDGEFTYEVIGFGMSDFFDIVNSSSRVDLAYYLGWDQWNPENSIQLEIKDIKISQ